MNFERQAIEDLVVIQPQVFTDSRGFFLETWHQEKFADAGIDARFVQTNHSMSRRGVMRGLHYQVEQPQGKLVRVLVGEIFDVAVDMRRSKPTYGKWLGVHLSAEKKNMLWIPPGFAHGFYVLSDVAEFMYFCTDFYSPQRERCLLWSDPDVGVEWPLDSSAPLIVSDKDKAGTPFRQAESYA